MIQFAGSFIMIYQISITASAQKFLFCASFLGIVNSKVVNLAKEQAAYNYYSAFRNYKLSVGEMLEIKFISQNYVRAVPCFYS
jgi:hypothetical protein